MAGKLKSYAFAVFVAGVKRYGGMCHAEDMESAVTRAAKICKLKVTTRAKGTIVESYDWTLDGKRASLCVWARPEDFVKQF